MPATPEILTHSVPNVTGVTAISVTEAYNSAMAQATIYCYDTTLSLGDSIGFNMGFSGDSGKIFQGYVRSIESGLPEAENIIICEDELAKASDYFMAANRPENPFSRSNIDTADLIEDILNEAQITSFSDDTALSVTWGTKGSIDFNLTTAWQACNTIINALAWHLYADRNGTVHLTEDKPYDDNSPAASFTWNLTTSNILRINSSRSTNNLRNRVVVYGKEGVTAIASTSSPYLPGGFYKTAVLASQIFDNTGLAQTAADANLELFNRLTEGLTLEVEGDYQIQPRKWVTVTIVDADISMNITGDWFIYQVDHNLSESGYTCNVTLTR